MACCGGETSPSRLAHVPRLPQAEAETLFSSLSALASSSVRFVLYAHPTTFIIPFFRSLRLLVRTTKMARILTRSLLCLYFDGFAAAASIVYATDLSIFTLLVGHLSITMSILETLLTPTER